MINTGKLFKHKTDKSTLCEVLRTWNKADIDPDCPESVAIVGMVRIVLLSGSDMGKEKTYRRTSFNRSWEVANA